MMAVSTRLRYTERKARILKSSRTTHGRKKLISKQKFSSLDVGREIPCNLIRADASNSLTKNKLARQKSVLIKQILSEEKRITRSTRQNVNVNYKNDPAAKIEKAPPRRTSRNTKFISQNVFPPILGKSSHESKKTTGKIRLKMSKFPSQNKISKSKTAKKLKEHKTATILKPINKAIHSHSTSEIQENLVETQPERSIKEYESENSDSHVTNHPHLKKECLVGSQDVSRKMNQKRKRSFSRVIHTSSRSESSHQFNGSSTQIKEFQTVFESTSFDSRPRTTRKYSYDKSENKSKIKKLESSYEKSAPPAKEPLNSKLTGTEFTRPITHSSNSKGKHPAVKRISKVSMETSSNSNETEKENTTSILTEPKQVTMDIITLKENLLEGLERSVQNSISEEPQASSSTETTPSFPVPSGENLKELEIYIKAAAEKAIANVDLANYQNFMLEMHYFNLVFYVGMMFKKPKEENGN